MLKQEIRKRYKEKRMTLSDDKVSFLSQSIVEEFVAFFKPKNGQKIHLYLPIKKFKEIDTQLLIDFSYKNNIRVFIPKMVGEELISIELKPHLELKLNAWGILEPSSLVDAGIVDFDFVITPLLYCDQFGNRVGYGKGFYDKLFSSLPPSTKKVGLSYFLPDESIDNVFDSDVPLDYLVTPNKVLSFSGDR